MYINEVIRRVDRLYPNEYTIKEKYNWCDDLSAMLCQEYLRRYEEVRLEAHIDGTYLLPEGVTFEMVDRIRHKGHVIKKLDFRSFGIKPMYGRSGQFYVPSHHGCHRKIEVVYIKPNEPIRDTVIKGSVKFYDDRFEFMGGGLIAGDVVIIKTDDGKEIDDVMIMDVRQLETYNNFVAEVPEGSLSVIHTSGEYTQKNCEIKRIVTDETVCDAPYDMMYVDYVLAQIFYYQRNYPSYNQHINLFNQRLEAYERWLQKRRVQEKDNKIYNWW